MVTILNSADARAMFPNVVGPIEGAELHSGFAVVLMGKRAFAVIVRGEFIGCCPTRKHAERAGQRRAAEA